jgi:hypothetical protein
MRFKQIIRRIVDFGRAEDGVLSGADYIITVSIITIGSIIGLATVRDAVLQEFGDIGVALENVSQTYTVNITFAGGATNTFGFTDGAAPTDTDGNAPGDISLSVPITDTDG